MLTNNAAIRKNTTQATIIITDINQIIRAQIRRGQFDYGNKCTSRIFF